MIASQAQADMATYWGWREEFGKAIDPRYYTLGWLDEEVYTRRAHFWGGEKSALITQFKDYPTGVSDIHVLIAAGDMSEIIEELAPLAEEYGRRQGCVAATVESRDGWKKVLASYGYQPFQLTLRKELG